MLRDTVKISYHGVFLSIGKVYMHQTERNYNNYVNGKDNIY